MIRRICAVARQKLSAGLFIHLYKSHKRIFNSNYLHLIIPKNVVMCLLELFFSVNNMNEVSYKNTDRYVRDNATVTVTCKPKLVYPSTATNWFNDLYRVRYLFPQEHELEKTVLNEQNDDPQYSKELNQQVKPTNPMSRQVMPSNQITKQTISNKQMPSQVKLKNQNIPHQVEIC